MKRIADCAATCLGVFLLAAMLCACGNEVRKDGQGGTNTNAAVVISQKKKAGFSLDDTLLYSTPTMLKALSLGYERNSDRYWDFVNSSDSGYSVPKQKTLSIVRGYLTNGDLVYIITSRPGVKKELLTAYLEKLTGVPSTNVYFEPGGKSARMYDLNLDFYYSDSDRDIQDALSGGVKPFRILRDTNSISRQAYNPGAFYEEIVEGSER